MILRETCWQSILRILGDGKPRRYAQIADASGFQVNTVERYCHEINNGKHGPYRIVTEPEPGLSTVLARLVSTAAPQTEDDFIRECRDNLKNYPADHPERAKVDAMIERYQKSHTREE
jgi:hypothetical protein